MNIYLLQVVNGIGMLYFLLAVGLSIVFGLLRFDNFAHGAFYLLGAYFCYQMMRCGLSFWLALALVLVPLVVGALGWLTEKLMLRHVYDQAHEFHIVVTVGLALAVQELVILQWGPLGDSVPVPELLQGVVMWGSFIYPKYRLFVIAFTALLAVLLWYVLEGTRLGSAVRAGSESTEMVSLLGINVFRIFSLVFALGAATAALAGVLAAPIRGAEPFMGIEALGVAFVVVVVGGMGSFSGALLGGLLIGVVQSVMSTLRSTTLHGGMRRAVDAARAAEVEGVPAVSIFAGFSLADIEAPCMSVVVTAQDTADGIARAQQAAQRIGDQIWAQRQDFVYQSEPLADSLQRASELASHSTRPVLLLDHSDNCMSGGTCDTMDVLLAAISHGLSGLPTGPLCDAQAVQQLISVGVGAQITLRLGNKVALTQLGLVKQPAQLTGTVRAISDGVYTVTGPIYTGQRCCMGRTVWLDIGVAQVVVTERPHEPFDLGVFHCVGLDPKSFEYVLLKSRMYCRPVFAPLCEGIVECDSAGVTSSDYSLFPFSRVRRPVYPLDSF